VGGKFSGFAPCTAGAVPTARARHLRLAPELIVWIALK